MEFRFCGWPADGPTLRLDYRAFSYAGKFVTGSTGKAILVTGTGEPAAPEWRPDRGTPETVDVDAFREDVLAAVSFSPDRTDASTLWLRYLTVHVARRGEGLGPELVARTLDRVNVADRAANVDRAADADSGFDRVRIAVNNPFAYEALYKVGFAFTGRETGLAELVLERPIDEPAPTQADADRYQDGLDRYRDRDLGDPEATFLRDREGASPPATGRPD